MWLAIVCTLISVTIATTLDLASLRSRLDILEQNLNQRLQDDDEVHGCPQSCIIRGLPGAQGPHGQRGLPGSNGYRARKGAQGDLGDFQLTGLTSENKYDDQEFVDKKKTLMTGYPGLYGSHGDKGQDGQDASCDCAAIMQACNTWCEPRLGDVGDTGDIGLPGLPGLDGNKGDSGDDI